jgi:hypothetical protein
MTLFASVNCDSVQQKSHLDSRVPKSQLETSDASSKGALGPIETGEILDAIESKSAYKHSYQVNVSLGSFDDLCEARIDMDIPLPIASKNNEPEKKASIAGYLGLEGLVVKCQDFELPVGDLVSAIGDDTSSGVSSCSDPKVIINADENAIGFDQIRCVRYEPALPLFPAILASSPEKLSALNLDRAIKADNKKTAVDIDTNLKTIAYDEPYTSLANPSLTFERTLAWEFQSQGAAGQNATIQHGLIDKIGIRLDMNKLTVLSLNLEINVINELEAILGEQSFVTRIAGFLLGDGVMKARIEIIE